VNKHILALMIDDAGERGVCGMQPWGQVIGREGSVAR